MDILGLSKNLYIYLLISLLFACSEKETKNDEIKNYLKFNPEDLGLARQYETKMVRGQLLYLPIYSNIPYRDIEGVYDLSAFVAIHNTDLYNAMKITKVLFFDNDGHFVADHLKNDTILAPLSALNFFIDEKDKSGTGANFLVEWVADTLINEPLIESVMIGLTSGQGVSFLSNGKVLRESR